MFRILSTQSHVATLKVNKIKKNGCFGSRTICCCTLGVGQLITVCHPLKVRIGAVSEEQFWHNIVRFILCPPRCLGDELCAKFFFYPFAFLESTISAGCSTGVVIIVIRNKIVATAQTVTVSKLIRNIYLILSLTGGQYSTPEVFRDEKRKDHLAANFPSITMTQNKLISFYTAKRNNRTPLNCIAIILIQPEVRDKIA